MGNESGGEWTRLRHSAVRSAWTWGLALGLLLMRCADPPGDSALSLTIVANRTGAEDIGRLAASFGRIEILHSQTPEAAPSRLFVEQVPQLLSLDFNGSEAVATLVLEVPHGFVHQLRFVSSVVTVGLVSGAEADAKLPSGAQTGIKIVPADGEPFPLRANSRTFIESRFLLTEQLVRSRGQEFLFKPTLTAELVRVDDLSRLEFRPLMEPGEVYVIFRDGTPDSDVAAALTATSTVELRRYVRRPWVTVRTDAGAEMEVAARFRTRQEVLWAAPNFNGAITAESLPSEWGSDQTVQPWSVTSRATEAWAVTQGTRDVVVAILDNGFGYHDEIEENVFLNVGEFPTWITRSAGCQATDGGPLPTVSDVAGLLDGGADGVITIADLNAPGARQIWLPLIGKDAGDSTARVRIADLIKMPSNECGIFEDGLDNDGNGFPDDIAGWSFSTNSNSLDFNTAAEASHGTTVAAVVGASESTNSVHLGVPNLLLARRAGVAWRVRLLLLSVSGSGVLGENAHRALEYAASMGASVANMSASTVCLDPSVGPLPGLSADRQKQIVCDASVAETVNRTWQNFISSAGAGSLVFTTGSTNEHFDVDSSQVTVMPAEADIPNMITVANMTTQLKLPRDRAPWGVKTFDIAAVGEGIPALTEEGFPFNTRLQLDGFAHNEDGGVTMFRGTSFSAPQVAGTAALLLSINPARYAGHPLETKSAILNSARTSGDLNTKVSAGRYLDVRAAVEAAGP